MVQVSNARFLFHIAFIFYLFSGFAQVGICILYRLPLYAFAVEQLLASSIHS